MEPETIAQAIDEARDGLLTVLAEVKDVGSRRHLIRALNTFKLPQAELLPKVPAGG